MLKKHFLKNGKDNPMYGKSVVNRKIVQLSLNGEFIQEYNSITEAQKTFTTKVNISAVCRGKRKQAKGFIWKYTEDYYGIKPEKKTRKKKKEV